MGDFNIDLLKYDMHGDSSDFLDAMYASFILLYISAPSRVTPHPKALIDNIFSNTIEDGFISGNLVTTISDHYGQFLLMKNLNNKKKTLQIKKYIIRTSKRLKVVPATFLLVCFISLNESTCQTRKNIFYFTSKALFVLEKIKF